MVESLESRSEFQLVGLRDYLLAVPPVVSKAANLVEHSDENLGKLMAVRLVDWMDDSKVAAMVVLMVVYSDVN